MDLKTIQPLAQKILEILQPYCERIQIAGSIRRQEPYCGDIEIVCIPLVQTVTIPPTQLFDPPTYKQVTAEGFTRIVNAWKKMKGEPTGKYTQRLYPYSYTSPGKDMPTTEMVKVDIFMPQFNNWGYILAIRTGSEKFSRYLAHQWKTGGYHGEDGYLRKISDNKPIPLREEEDLFKLLNLKFVEPWNRK